MTHTYAMFAVPAVYAADTGTATAPTIKPAPQLPPPSYTQPTESERAAIAAAMQSTTAQRATTGKTATGTTKRAGKTARTATRATSHVTESPVANKMRRARDAGQTDADHTNKHRGWLGKNARATWSESGGIGRVPVAGELHTGVLPPSEQRGDMPKKSAWIEWVGREYAAHIRAGGNDTPVEFRARMHGSPMPVAGGKPAPDKSATARNMRFMLGYDPDDGSVVLGNVAITWVRDRLLKRGRSVLLLRELNRVAKAVRKP